MPAAQSFLAPDAANCQPPGSIPASTVRPNIVYCDGGLCNRLNALIYALALRQRFGHEWSICWPQNNWCGASLDSLFSINLPVHRHSLQYFSRFQDDYLFLMHENQCGFNPARIVYNRSMTTMEAYERLLNCGTAIFYYNNLFPHLVDIGVVKGVMKQLKIRPDILRRAQHFCSMHAIDGNVLGLHIRKTDFGNLVNDDEIFDIVEKDPRRFFVCSDDRMVNERFRVLTNCSVFEKNHFPVKMLESDGWNAATIDSEGRRFPYNIARPEDSVVEALVDLLILSATTPVRTSGSTFLGMATMFNQISLLETAVVE